MNIKFSHLLSALIVVATSTTGIAHKAIADTDSYPSDQIIVQPLPTILEEGLFNESGTHYYNRSLERQATFLFGPGFLGGARFPDLEIERDAKLVNTIYRDALYQQVSSDPIIRTLDLPNPYNTSVRTMPSSRYLNNRVMGSEFVYERVPLR